MTHKPEQRVDSRLVKVTPDLARGWIKNSIWKKQRELRLWHVEELAEAMKRGEFTAGTQIHFARLNGIIHNVNGRHTLEAIASSGCTIELSVLTTKVETEEQIADLYARHDRHLARTLSDTYEAHGIAEKHGLNRGNVAKIGAAIAAIVSGFKPNMAKDNRSYQMRSPDERNRLMNEYVDFGRMYVEAIKGAPAVVQAQLRTANVLGVGILTFQIDQEQAAKFWSQVAHCDGLNVGDVRKTLTNWLLANPQKKATGGARARVAAQAWNAFLQNKELTRFKTPDVSAPLVLDKPPGALL